MFHWASQPSLQYNANVFYPKSFEFYVQTGFLVITFKEIYLHYEKQFITFYFTLKSVFIK